MYKYADSCCYILEINTALKSNHIPIKLNFLKNYKKRMLGSKFYQLDHFQRSGDNSYICVCEYKIYIHICLSLVA